MSEQRQHGGQRRWRTWRAVAVVVGVWVAGAAAQAWGAEAPGGGAAGWTPRWGARLDVGVPQGVAVSALLRPLRWANVYGGLTLNTLGYGMRVGGSFAPVPLLVTPVVDVGLGYAFHADYNALVSRLGGQPDASRPLQQGVAWFSMDGSLGLEWSPSERVTLQGLGGVSYWLLRLDDASAFLRDPGLEGTVTAQPLWMRVSVPTVKLSLLVNF